ncbi:MAG: TIGR00725 family protein [Planctomycetota bacterium]
MEQPTGSAGHARGRVIAVIGQGECDDATRAVARTVGRLLAERGCVLISGGMGGVMEAASQGAAEAGGLVVGVLPGPSPTGGNPHLGLAIATGMGEARNVILANTAEAFVAVAGSYGTLSEVAFALKRGKTVVSLGSWEIDPAVRPAASPEEAVELVLAG